MNDRKQGKKRFKKDLKQHLAKVLAADDFETRLLKLDPDKDAYTVNLLMSFFFGEDLRKWRAVSGLGLITDRLARTDPERAKVVARRLMWMLNDESGGIGWGAPEALGDICARNRLMCDGFYRILFSYIRPDGNFLELPELRRGAMWGVARLLHARPELAPEIQQDIISSVSSGDAVIRGLAALSAARLDSGCIAGYLQKLRADRAKIVIYIRHRLLETSVGSIARGEFPVGDSPQKREKPSP